MKLVFILFIFLTVKSYSQDSASYAKILTVTNEITIADSIRLSTDAWNRQRLDSNDVKKWFSPLLGSLNNNRLKNRSYFLAGKITSPLNFDILILLEEKKKADTIESVVVHLVTTRKNGGYISSLETAVRGNKKKSNYNTSSFLFSDLTIRKDSHITVNERKLDDLEIYRINSGGRFILYPDY